MAPRIFSFVFLSVLFLSCVPEEVSLEDSPHLLKNEVKKESEVEVEGEFFGSNFGFRCEDKDGLSAGSNIAENGACFTATEAVLRAKEECLKIN